MVIIPITNPVHYPLHIDVFYLGFNYHRLKSALQPAPGEAATRTCRQTPVSSEQIRRRPMRANVTTALKSSPGALVFGRDMFLNVPLVADWTAIATRREQLVNESLRKANLKRISHDYAVGDRVLKKVWQPTKLGERTHGPYAITRVHTNGNVTLRLSEGVTERVNIRRIKPYRD